MTSVVEGKSLGDYLCLLPCELLQTIVQYWTIEEWSKLDIALTTRHPFKKSFFGVLSTVPVTVTNNYLWHKRLENGILDWIISRRINIVSWENKNCDDERLALIAHGLPNLLSLDVAVCNEVTDKGITVAIPKLSSLQSLSTSKCTDTGLKTIIAVSELLLHLTNLDMSWSHTTTDEGFGVIANGGLPNLKSLTLEGCYRITDIGLKVFENHRLPHLKVLSINKLTEITDAGIKYITVGLPQLESLDISGCGNVTDAGIEMISNTLINLVSLNVGECGLVTDVGLGFLANGNLSKLKSLNIILYNMVTDEGLRVLANGNLSKLTSLDLTECYNNLTDAGLALLSSGNLSSLLSLNLSICSGFTDVGYAALAANLQQLESLHLWTTEITDVGLAALANGNLLNLKLLDLSCNANITDAGLLALADGKLSNLQSLKLFRCLGVTDAGIQAVVRASTKLKSLNMDQCNVTDAWLPQEECVVLTQLEDVSIEFCENISDDGVVAIATRLCNLRSLNISWCRNVSDASLVSITKLSLPSLKKLIIGGECTKITATGRDLFCNRDIIEYRGE